jgi:hypothetical protein
MDTIRNLIDKSIEELKSSEANIFGQIEEILKVCKSEDLSDYYLFHIDDRSWYSTYFHAYKKNEVLSEVEINLPKYLEEIVNKVGDSEDDEMDEQDFFTEVNDELMEILSKGWKKHCGNDLKQPCFITFHDADYYYDIEKDKVFSENELEYLMK